MHDRLARSCSPRSSPAWLLAVAVLVMVSACASDTTPSGQPPAGSPGSTTQDSSTASAGCAAGRPVEAGTTSRTIDRNGQARNYLLTIPPGYDASRPAPLVLNMHGARGTGAKVNATSDLPAKAGARGYVVVAPDAQTASVQAGASRIEGGVWNLAPAFTDPATQSADTSTSLDATLGADDDVAFVNDLLDTLEAELCLDESRQYAAGKSAGAGMTTWIACQTGQRFAAVAPVAGVNMPKYCPGTEVPPLITFHGDADEPMPYAGGTVVDIDLGVPDVDTRLTDIASKQGCTNPMDSPVADDVVHRVWTCPAGHAVELYKVLGGGHTWPGEDPAGAAGLGQVTDSIDATELMLDFFAEHTAAP